MLHFTGGGGEEEVSSVRLMIRGSCVLSLEASV